MRMAIVSQNFRTVVEYDSKADCFLSPEVSGARIASIDAAVPALRQGFAFHGFSDRRTHAPGGVDACIFGTYGGVH